MLQRFFIAMLLAASFVPTLVAAEAVPTLSPLDATGSPTSTDATGLGPQTQYPGGSSADSGALQPAGQSPLQSTTQDANGLTAPNSNALQAPVAGSNDLQVVTGDADGKTHQMGDSSGAGTWVWTGAILGLIVVATLIVARDRHRFAKTEI